MMLPPHSRRSAEEKRRSCPSCSSQRCYWCAPSGSSSAACGPGSGDHQAPPNRDVAQTTGFFRLNQNQDNVAASLLSGITPVPTQLETSAPVTAAVMSHLPQRTNVPWNIKGFLSETRPVSLDRRLPVLQVEASLSQKPDHPRSLNISRINIRAGHMIRAVKPAGGHQHL